MESYLVPMIIRSQIFQCVIFFVCLTFTQISFSQVVRVCDAISNATKEFAIDKNKGMTKQQLRERSIRVASEEKISDDIVDSWFYEIDWVFRSANRNLSPDKIKAKRFDECRNDLKKKGY